MGGMRNEKFRINDLNSQLSTFNREGTKEIEGTEEMINYVPIVIES
jgi:hypothetical protein